ncbi:MAG: hypothetical protein JO244_06560 [Solirubrobacterales bacterium]|nr:hypothetical protein [Solirubrobacterales bacterium]
MTWVESASRSFRARHDSAGGDDAERVLHTLELARERLSAYFPTTIDGLTVVLHRSALSLSLARPVVAGAWLATAPSARRYLAGWAGREELHLLEPSALEDRASGVPGSREMLELTPVALYARRVIDESNPDLPARPTPRRVRAELRWGWMLEGAARWFSGQVDHARPAIARRLHEGSRPAFPPGPRDALLLGGTVIDLLAREEGEHAAAELACRLHPQGPRAALSRAFRGRPFAGTEEAWRTHLRRLAAAS